MNPTDLPISAAEPCVSATALAETLAVVENDNGAEFAVLKKSLQQTKISLAIAFIAAALLVAGFTFKIAQRPNAIESSLAPAPSSPSIQPEPQKLRSGIAIDLTQAEQALPSNTQTVQPDSAQAKRNTKATPSKKTQRGLATRTQHR